MSITLVGPPAEVAAANRYPVGGLAALGAIHRRDDQSSSESMKTLHGITFLPALVIGPEGKVAGDEITVGFKWELSAPRSVGPGVYLLYSNDRLVYVGSYQSGIARRWLYTRKDDLYHFKKKQIVDELRTNASLRLFAQDEDVIKAQINEADNPWITAAGIEAVLIRAESPPWNRIGKKKNIPNKTTKRPPSP